MIWLRPFLFPCELPARLRQLCFFAPQWKTSAGFNASKIHLLELMLVTLSLEAPIHRPSFSIFIGSLSTNALISNLPQWLITLSNSSQPAYLHSLLSYHIPTHSLRSFNTNLLSVPRVHTTFASCGLSIAAPSVWNSLPSDIRACFSSHTLGGCCPLVSQSAQHIFIIGHAKTLHTTMVNLSTQGVNGTKVTTKLNW